MPDVIKLLKDKDMSSLAPFMWQGGVYTRGRLGRKGMMAALGHSQLLVLPNTSRFAYLVMWQIHSLDHRLDAGDLIHRSRLKGLWIVRARSLAESIIKDCGLCTERRKIRVAQQIGDRPITTLAIEQPPFTHIAIDFMGPVLVRDEVKGRASKKVFPMLLVCLVTKCLHVQIASGYDTQSFMLQLQDFMSIRGRPLTIYTDAGNQLVKAGTLDKDLLDGVKWSKVVEDTAKEGITWRHAPAGAQWRNGVCESLVKQMKKTLPMLVDGGDWSYSQCVTQYRRAVGIVNDRPLGIQVHSGADAVHQPITPNLLLQSSRTYSGVEDTSLYEASPDKLTEVLREGNKRIKAWWQVWFVHVFPGLVPLRTWKHEQRNVRPGDIVLVCYDNKYSVGDYRRGKVSRVEYDEKGLVRTAYVWVYKRDAREKPAQYVPKGLKEVKLPVQRLVVLLPSESQEGN